MKNDNLRLVFSFQGIPDGLICEFNNADEVRLFQRGFETARTYLVEREWKVKEIKLEESK